MATHTYVATKAKPTILDVVCGTVLLPFIYHQQLRILFLVRVQILYQFI